MSLEHYLGTPYDFNAGPQELTTSPDVYEKMNCQRALQLYFKEVYGHTMAPHDALSSNLYTSVGRTVAEEQREYFQDNEFLKSVLKPTDILCTLSKRKHQTLPSFAKLEEDKELQKTLHIAITIGDSDSPIMQEHFPEVEVTDEHRQEIFVFHASYKKGKKVALWPLSEIQKYYWIMRIKEPDFLSQSNPSDLSILQ